MTLRKNKRDQQKCTYFNVLQSVVAKQQMWQCVGSGWQIVAIKIRVISIQNVMQHLVKYFLGAFTKLLKETVSFVIHVCLSVTIERLSSHWTDYHGIWFWNV